MVAGVVDGSDEALGEADQARGRRGLPVEAS